MRGKGCYGEYQTGEHIDSGTKAIGHSVLLVLKGSVDLPFKKQAYQQGDFINLHLLSAPFFLEFSEEMKAGEDNTILASIPNFHLSTILGRDKAQEACLLGLEAELRRVRLIQRLSKQQGKAILPLLQLRHYEKEEIIEKEGVESVWFVLKGEVQCEARVLKQYDYFQQKSEQQHSYRANGAAICWTLSLQHLRNYDKNLYTFITAILNSKEVNLEDMEVVRIGLEGEDTYMHLRRKGTLLRGRLLHQDNCDQDLLELESHLLSHSSYFPLLLSHLTFPNCVLSLFQHMQGATLSSLLSQFKTAGMELHPIHKQQILASYILSLESLHSKGYAFLDSRHENVFVEDSMQVRLVGLRNARRLGSTSAHFVVASRCLAPELLAGKAVAVSADYWSLGVFIYRLYTSGMPFSEQEFAVATSPNAIPPLTKATILVDRIRYPLGMNIDAEALCRRLFNPYPDARLPGGLDTLKDSKLFEGFSWASSVQGTNKKEAASLSVRWKEEEVWEGVSRPLEEVLSGLATRN